MYVHLGLLSLPSFGGDGSHHVRTKGILENTIKPAAGPCFGNPAYPSTYSMSAHSRASQRGNFFPSHSRRQDIEFKEDSDLCQVVSSELELAIPNTTLEAVLPWPWSPFSWMAFLSSPTLPGWILGHTYSSPLVLVFHNSLRSVLRLPSMSPLAPPCLPAPGIPPHPCPENLPQSEKGLCWPCTSPAPAHRGRRANWLLVSMTLMSDCKDAEEALEMLSLTKCCLLWQDRKRPSASEKFWQWGTAWRAEETEDEWAARDTEETVDLTYLLSLIIYIKESAALSNLFQAPSPNTIMNRNGWLWQQTKQHKTKPPKTERTCSTFSCRLLL